MGAWTKKRTRCPQCGVMYYPNTRLHKESVYHKHHAEIASRLGDVRNSFAAVAKDFGLSRERVRRIAEQLGFQSGRKIQSLRRELLLAEEFDRAFPDKKNLQGLGLKFEKLLRKDGHLSTRFIKVNGHTCVMGRAWPSPLHGGGYVRLSHYARPDAEFVLYRLPPGGPGKPQQWLVVPVEAAPTRSGLYALVGRGPSSHFSVCGTPKSYQGKWLRYIDAWHLLKEQEIRNKRKP